MDPCISLLPRAARPVAIRPARADDSAAAQRLLEAAIERSRQCGARTVGLHTTGVMTTAVRLYERRGFVRRPDLDIGAGELLAEDAADAPLVIGYELLDDWARRELHP